nr:hypothetical protein CFP56_16839 [Quercus suber]
MKKITSQAPMARNRQWHWNPLPAPDRPVASPDLSSDIIYVKGMLFYTTSTLGPACSARTASWKVCSDGRSSRAKSLSKRAVPHKRKESCVTKEGLPQQIVFLRFWVFYLSFTIEQATGGGYNMHIRRTTSTTRRYNSITAHRVSSRVFSFFNFVS